MFVTTWSQKVLKRSGDNKGRVIEEARIYQTKTLTDMHKHIHRKHQSAKTFAHPNQVYTHFIAGITLPEPIVRGGFIVNMAAA